jgi:hypothetical protein
MKGIQILAKSCPMNGLSNKWFWEGHGFSPATLER